MKRFSKKRVTTWLLITMIILSTFGGLRSPAMAKEQVVKSQLDIQKHQSKLMPNVPFELDTAVSLDSEQEQFTQQTAVVSFPQKLTDWVLDKESGMIYAISDSTNKLYFINKQTLAITKELQLSAKPSDMYKFENKLYISQENNLIQTVDLTSKLLDEQYPTNSEPLDVAVSATHIFFATDWPTFYSIDRTTKAVKSYNIRMRGNIDIQAGSDNRTIYLTDRGWSSSKFYSYDIAEDKIISVANDGFSSPSGEIIIDEQSAYFAGYRMNKNDLSDFLGEYQWLGDTTPYYATKILNVSSKYVLTTQGIYDKNTYLNLATLPIEPTEGILDEDGSVILFKSEASSSNNKIFRYSITLNQDPKVQMNKLANMLESNFKITDWVTTEETPYIYAISENANALTVIRKSDFSTIKSVWIGSRPVDVEISYGKVYVALRGESYIAQFNIADTENANFSIEKRLVKGLPIKIEPFNGKIFYTVYGERHKIKVLTESNVHSVLPVDSWYYELDAKEEALYVIGDLNHKKINANTHSTLLSGSYHNVFYDERDDLHKDGNFLYYNNRRLSTSNLSTVNGTYPETVLYAKDDLVFGSKSIYDRDTFTKIIDLPLIISKAYVADDQSIIVSSGKKLIKYADLNDADTNNITPRNSLFIDTDDREGWVTGYLLILPTENANTIQSYNAYFTDSLGNKFVKLNMVLESQENGVLRYKLLSTYSTPDLSQIGIYPVLSSGVELNQYVTTEVWDSPTYFARNISLTDTQFTGTEFSGTVTWDKAKKQLANSSYQIYFMDEDGIVGEPIKTVMADKLSYSVNISNVPIPHGTIGIGITLIKSNGEEPPNFTGVIFEKLISKSPLLQKITITNNLSSNDTVTVTGLTTGDIIRVYNEAETTLLGQGKVAAGQTSVTISISNLGSPGQKISVTCKTIDLYESVGTLVIIPNTEAPPIVTPPPTGPIPTPAPTPTPTGHTIKVTAGAHGTISPSGSVLVDEGSNQKFTITPEKGYEIATLQVDGVEESVTNNSYTFTNVKNNHTISVTFKAVIDVSAPLAPIVNEVTDTVTTITGTAEAGAKVTAKIGTKVIGEAVANTTGQFRIIIAKQVAGITIVVTATDEANNVSEPTAKKVRDMTPPSSPVVKVVKDNAKKVTGTAEPESIVTVMIGSKVIGSAKADNDGDFSIVIPPQKEGTVLKISAKDRVENTSKPTSVTVIDKTPPAKPTVDTVNSSSIKVTGKTEADTTVIVIVGSKVTGTATAGKDGKFSVKIPKQKARVVLTVIVKDKNGNESVAVKVTVKK